MMSDAFALWMAQNVLLFTIIIIVVSVWSTIWKGIALWKSAKKDNLVWFIVFLVVNTVGILEILYIFWFSRLGNKAKKRKRK